MVDTIKSEILKFTKRLNLLQIITRQERTEREREKEKQVRKGPAKWSTKEREKEGKKKKKIERVARQDREKMMGCKTVRSLSNGKERNNTERKSCYAVRK